MSGSEGERERLRALLIHNRGGEGTRCHRSYSGGERARACPRLQQRDLSSSSAPTVEVVIVGTTKESL